MPKNDLRAKLSALKDKKGASKKPAKVEIRKRAAKPLTPDELAQRAQSAKPRKEKGLDLSSLRNATGSTAPIHLFRAIRALGDAHIPTIISLLQNEHNIRQHSPKYKLMQPVYLIVDGTGAYVNDYCLAHLIDADENYLKFINSEGTMIATFPHGSTSIHTMEEFRSFEAELKPASEKPVRVKTPLMGATDFEPPTINDAIDAGRVPKRRLAHSDLYTLFTSFSDGSSLALGTVAEGEKVKKNKTKKLRLEAESEAGLADEEQAKKEPKESNKADVIKSSKSGKRKLKKNKKAKKEASHSEPAAKVSKLDKIRTEMLSGLDLSGYEHDPNSKEPTVVADQRSEAAARLLKYKEPRKTKVFMPLTPNATKVKRIDSLPDDVESTIEVLPTKVKERLNKTIKKSTSLLNKAARLRAKSKSSKSKNEETTKASSKPKSKAKSKSSNKKVVEITQEESLKALSILTKR